MPRYVTERSMNGENRRCVARKQLVMTQIEDESREMRLDTDSFAQGYFRNAVYRHWDPYAVDGLETDRERLADHGLTQSEFDEFCTGLSRFGAGEEAVTEELMPLALVLEDVDDQMFVSSQIYEEAKHAQFFDRYWREVVDPLAEAFGFERRRPTDPTPLVSYAGDKLSRRIEILTDANAEVPPVDELVELGDTGTTAD